MRKSTFAFLGVLVIAINVQLAAGADGLDFTLEDINGNLFTLSDHYSKPEPTLRGSSEGNPDVESLTDRGLIMLVFWATWCTPCKDELPYIQKLHEKYSELGLTVATISEDSPKSQAKVRPYVRSKRYTFPVLLDPTREILQLFQGNTLPHRVLLDRQGNVMETHQGYNPGDEVILEDTIRGFLNPERSDG